MQEQKVQISRSVIAKIESGYRGYVTLDEFIALTAVLGIDQVEFLNSKSEYSRNLTPRRPMGRAYAEEAPPWTDKLEKIVSRLAAKYNLTPSESEVLALLTEGISNREISYRLFLSPATVSHRITDLLDKLGASSRFAIIQVILSETISDSS
jgi:DNA-binding NarL/FixJ family response regulator